MQRASERVQSCVFVGLGVLSRCLGMKVSVHHLLKGVVDGFFGGEGFEPICMVFLLLRCFSQRGSGKQGEKS